MIKIISPGQMIYDTPYIELSKNITEKLPCLMIKETKTYLDKICKNNTYNIRVGVIPIGNVIVVPMLILVNDNFDMLYETMINFYSEGGLGRNFTKLLSTQSKIVIQFFNEHGELAISQGLKNDVRDSFQSIYKVLEESSQWTMHDFDMAKAKLYAKVSSPQILWEHLRR